jgi:Acyltransferase family
VRSEKDVPLEALRGLAAIVVINCHLVIGFWPSLWYPLKHPWWFGPFNGNAAVSLFFVLSGLVLTRRAIQTKNLGSLTCGPRLSVIRACVALFSWRFCFHGLSGRLPHSANRADLLADTSKRLTGLLFRELSQASDLAIGRSNSKNDGC